MKIINIIFKAFVVVLLLGLYACSEEYLEITPKSELSAESVFSTQAGADLFLNDVYNRLPILEAGLNTPRQSPWANFDQLNYFSHYYASRFTWSISQRRLEDRALTPDTWTGRSGLYNHGYPASPRYNELTPRIRSCNFFLQMMEDFKDLYEEDWRTTRIAEARVLRAFYYSEAWKVFGGVPLVTVVLDQLSMGDDIFMPSASIKELADFIIKECGEAADDLPNVVGDGHITQGAALALKANIELHMGDIATDPRPAGIGGQGDPIPYYTACAATCSEIMGLGYDLFPSYNDQFLAANNNNIEAIWSIQHLATTNPSWRTGRFGPFASYWSGNQAGTGMPTQQLIDMYRMSDGLTIDQSPLYDPDKPYENREQRFYESIIYDNSFYNGYLWTLEGVGEAEGILREGVQVTTGYFRKKGLETSLTAASLGDQEYCNEPMFRYAEILLYYAEAKIKAGAVDQTAIDAINQVRLRSDLPTVEESHGTGTGLSTEELLDIIWYERSVELAFERSKSYWDCIRMRKAEEHWGTPKTGIRRDSVGNYEEFVIYNQVPMPDNQYLYPIYRGWLEKNPAWMDPANQVDGRVAGQNPGY